ncbi:L-2-hydroxyglutarate oxidase LhgO [Streptosporangium album]|uniref:L-2-hydroxyglutarate oxidase LhgO n=1 Tax=Streptosporangium album TaxID=47479 RepID=A0A7W7WEW1_9ACTN|nr:FAD-dependent oxidoreductase [Streptosporangium album]MBB4943860.1 L-2-hydroxyglutarate oxidase LhgO [Streptosporangium album]
MISPASPATTLRRAEPFFVDEVYRQVPHLGEGALGGLTVPDESIICTWTTNLALATDAVLRGATLLLGRSVEAVEVHGDSTVLRTSAGEVNARWVVNAAGLGADVIDRLFGYDRFTVTPRRGELLVYDKLARPLVDRIVLPVPTARGKGVLISPTIYGNVMLGPTAEDLTDRTDTGTSERGLAFLLGKGEKLMPELLREEVTATYAGLRAASDHPDYLVEADGRRRYVLAGGIRSTGLTSGIAVAEHVADLARDAGLVLVPREDLPEPPHMPNIGEAYLRPYRDAARIAADPAYGTVVCFCERVTAGEIRDTFRSPIPPAGQVRLVADEPFRWVSPEILRPGDPAPARRRLLLWSDRYIPFPRIVLRQDGKVVGRRRLWWPAAPGRVFRIPTGILAGVDPQGGTVHVGVDA